MSEKHQKDDLKTKSSDSDATFESTLQSTPPHLLNNKMVTNEQQQQAISDIIDQWHQKIQQEISEVLKNNGVDKFHLTYVHEGMKDILIASNLPLFDSTILAKKAYEIMKHQVDKRLRIDNG